MKCMENMLSTWKDYQYQCHIPASMLLVQDKAYSIYEDLSKRDDNVTPFSASTGWFSRCTKRYNFHNMNMTGKLLLLTLWLSYTIKDEAVNPLNAWEHMVLNGNTVFNLHNIFQEHNPWVKRDIPVYISRNSKWSTIHPFTIHMHCLLSNQ